MVFSRVTLYPLRGQQSDAVQSGAASASAERVFSGRRNGDRRISRADGGRQLEKFELSPRGIHWDELNEDLSLEGFLSTQKLLPVSRR